MVVDDERIDAVEPNHGLLVSVNPLTGRVRLVKDLFEAFGDYTYTSLAIDRGDLYVGALGVAFDRQHRLYALQSPIFIPGTGSLVRIDRKGHIETIVSGLVFPSSPTRGPDDAFYISERG